MTVSAGSGWTGALYKTSDESKTNNTVGDDSTLVLTLNADKYYRVRFQILYWANATADFRYAWKNSAVVSGCLALYGMNAVGTLSANVGGNMAHNAYDAAAIAAGTLLGCDGSATTTLRGVVAGHGLFRSAASSPGTFALQWAQITTNATAAKVYAGSFLLYEEFT